MPIQIKIEQRGASINQLRTKFFRVLDKLQRPDPSRSVKKVAEVWAVNYKAEGGSIGGWANLAERTIEERVKRGFGGEHPILIRQGSLYAMSTLFFMQGQAGRASATTRSSGQAVTTTANLDISGGTATLSLGGPIAARLQRGDPSTNLPARTYWFTNRSVVMAARLGVIEWIKDEVVT